MTIRITYLALLFSLSGVSSVFSQANTGSIQPIIDKGLHWAQKIEEKDKNSQILKLEFDLAHDDNYTMLDLEEGKTYVFGAFSDDRIIELSLIIMKENSRCEYEEFYKKAIGGDNAIFSIEIPETGHYAIDVQINELKNENELGHYGLIVCEKSR